jgi:hypothetical protein
MLDRHLTLADMRDFSDWGREILKQYPYLKTEILIPCGCSELDEVCDARPALSNVTMHLNNKHKWSRERIADWLETEEEKLGYVLLSEETSNSVSEGAPCSNVTVHALVSAST